MDYNMDPLSGMLLGDLELFPECTLSTGLDKNEPLEIFGDHDCQPKSFGTSSAPSLTDDVFPDWLDLKMDMALLEGLETPDVLDDLLLGEVTTGQSMDILPALQMEAKTFPNPLDFGPLSHQKLVSIESPQVVSPVLNAVSNVHTSPPSSPDWRVPDITLCSPASFSQISEPGSPGYMTKSVSPSPASAQDSVLASVASVVPSVHIVTTEASVATSALPLDSFLSLSFLFESENACVHMIQPSLMPSEASAPTTPPATPPPVLVAKAKRNKIKATRNTRTSIMKLKVSRSSEGDSDDNYLAAPISKKERKRKQNKDAALRYRVKKRLETDVLAEEENQLLEVNKELRDKAQQLSNELAYLKNLMREMFKVKGLL